MGSVSQLTFCEGSGKSKIIVTGVSGFIAQNLCKHFSRLGQNLIALTRDPCRTPFLDGMECVEIMSYQSIGKINWDDVEGIIHLANLQTWPNSIEGLSELIHCNVTLGAQLLYEASRMLKHEIWVINVTTWWTNTNLQGEYSPLNLYAATKQSFIDLCEYFNQNKKLNIFHLELSDTYGANDCRPKLIAKWLNQVIDPNSEVIKMCSKNYVMSLIYIDDVVDAFQILLNHLRQGTNLLTQYFSVKGPEILSLGDMALIFERVFHFNLRLIWEEWSEQITIEPNPRRFPLVPTWSPKTNFEEGLGKILKSYDFSMLQQRELYSRHER